MDDKKNDEIKRLIRQQIHEITKKAREQQPKQNDKKKEKKK